MVDRVALGTALGYTEVYPGVVPRLCAQLIQTQPMRKSALTSPCTPCTGGLLVLEPQPWRSYCNAVVKKQTAAVPFSELHALQLRPEGFLQLLTEVSINEGEAMGGEADAESSKGVSLAVAAGWAWEAAGLHGLKCSLEMSASSWLLVGIERLGLHQTLGTYQSLTKQYLQPSPCPFPLPLCRRWVLPC